MMAAVNVTEFPGQNGFLDAVIDIPAGTLLLIVTDNILLATGFVTGQTILEVRMQNTRLPDAGM